MTNIKERNVEDILDDLRYAFATPEAEDFMFCINEKNYRKAKNMLLKKIEASDAALVIKHFKDKVKNKFKLVEITYNDFERNYPYNGVISSVQVVVNYRSQMCSGYLSTAYGKEWSIYIGHNVVRLKDVDQLWLVEKK
jgi:hypothetical protein